ncbi:MAG: hypothetical protein Q4C87_02525 [Actinomycetaceae bacterium]|nr:hypothetical protein [Actinomycetaceae bacterium]
MEASIDIAALIAEYDNDQQIIDRIRSMDAEERKAWQKAAIQSLTLWGHALDCFPRVEYVFTEKDGYLGTGPWKYQWQRADFAFRLILVALLLDLSPQQVGALYAKYFVVHLERDEIIETQSALVDCIVDKGKEWAEKFISSFLRKARRNDRLCLIILSLNERLDLPVAHNRHYLQSWFTDRLNMMSGWGRAPQSSLVGQKWEEHFLAFSERPNAHNDPTYISNDFTLEVMKRRVAELDQEEPLDKNALFSNLIQIIERPDALQAQKNALWWMEILGVFTEIRALANPSAVEKPTLNEEHAYRLYFALLQTIERASPPGLQKEAAQHLETLGLLHYVQDNRRRIIDALPLTHSNVLKTLLAALFSEKTSEEELYAIANAVLPRKEKGIKRDILRRLERYSAPPHDIVEMVLAIAQTGDVTTSKMAGQLLKRWGISAEETPQINGLWNLPSKPESAAFLAPDALILDDCDLEEAFAHLNNARHISADYLECFLAQVVATAHKKGPTIIARAVQRLGNPSLAYYVPRIFALLGRGIIPGTPIPPVTSHSGPLFFFDAQRLRDILYRLGELPCLLSTPSTEHFRISTDDFADRLRQYDRAQIAVEPTDIAIALGRMTTSEAENLMVPPVPIRGCDLTATEVVEIWRNTQIEPAELSYFPPERKWEPDEGTLKVTGQSPRWLSLLGVDSAYTRPCVLEKRAWKWGDNDRLPPVWSCKERPTDYVGDPPSVLSLFPSLQGRSVFAALRELIWHAPGSSLPYIEVILHTAPRVQSSTAALCLLALSTYPPKHRDVLIPLLFDSWDRGCLSGEDLIDGWQDPLWDSLGQQGDSPFKRSPTRVATALDTIAEAGGLALSWPLLTHLAEEVATHQKIPAFGAKILDTVLRYLPEVRAAGVEVNLPATCALANRKGKTQAILTAKKIAEKIASHGEPRPRQ